MSKIHNPSVVSNCKTLAFPTTSRNSSDLASTLREKGWSIRDAADYLGVSRQRLYSVFADPGRVRLWECAIAGMPVCTPAIGQVIKEARRRRAKPAPKRNRAAHVFAVGDCVVASRDAGIAKEKEEGWIADIRGHGISLELLVKAPGGQQWFRIENFHASFVANGKTRNPGTQP